MAEHKVQGGTMLLFIDPAGGTNYDTVVCLTSVGKTDSIDPVDASSACGPDKSPGKVAISYSFEGQHLQDPDTGKISGTSLRQLLRAKTFFGFKIAPVTPVLGDEIEEGVGYFSELSSTYSFDSVGTFSGVIQPVNQPTITVDTTPPVPANAFRFFINNEDGSYGGVGLLDMYFTETIDVTLSGDLPGYTSPVTYTSVTNVNVPTFSFPVGSYYIDIIFSSVALTNFRIYFTSMNIDNFDISEIVNMEVEILNFDVNRLPSSKVNQLLAYGVAYGLPYGIGQVITVNQVPSASPTGQGVTDAATLIGNGWTVSTD